MTHKIAYSCYFLPGFYAVCADFREPIDVGPKIYIQISVMQQDVRGTSTLNLSWRYNICSNWSCKMASHLLVVFKGLQNIDWSKWLLRDGCSYHDRSTSMFNTWQKTLWVECILWLSPNKKLVQIEKKDNSSVLITFTWCPQTTRSF